MNSAFIISGLSSNNIYAETADASKKVAIEKTETANQQSQNAVSTEKSIEGLITKKEICPTIGSAHPPCFESETSIIKTDVKEYVLSLEDISDRYEVILKPNISVKIADKGMLPDQLVAGRDFIKITYSQSGDKTSVTSVSLEKVKPTGNIKRNSILIGLAAIGILFILMDGFLKKIAGVKGGLFVGQDNRYSNSKFQMVLWTFIVIFSYIALYFERLLASTTTISFSSIIDIPQNLGILMGISVGSFLGAKTITFSKVQSGSIVKKEGKKSLVDLITDDNKVVDWGDAQMFAWTLVAIMVYFINFYKMLGYLDPSPEVSLPDVDSTLLVLTGFSQAAYMGKKLVASDVKPSITSIEPNEGAKIGQRIIINGTSFGNAQGKIIFDDKIELPIVSWYDSAILAKIPDGTITGKTLLSVEAVSAQVATSSYNILPSDNNPPTITSVDPKDGAKPGSQITINGSAFGKEQGIISFGDNKLTITSWSDSVILAQIPSDVPPGKKELRVQTATKQSSTSSYNILGA